MLYSAMVIVSDGDCSSSSRSAREGGAPLHWREREITYRNAIGVLVADALGLGLALLKGMLVFELGTHV